MSAVKVLLQRRLGWVVGLGFLLIGLCRYRSFENRPVFDRWSYAHVLLLVLTAALLAMAVVSAWRSRPVMAPVKVRPGASGFLQIACLVWGGAYLLAAVDDPLNGGRIGNLIFIGSSMPAAAMLEWVALVAAITGMGLWVAPRLGNRLSRIALALGAVLALCLLAEGVLRIKVALIPATQGFPGFSSQAWERRYVKLNTEGFRDEEHARKAAGGVRRLLVVGDSYAFGAGIKRTRDRAGELVAASMSSSSGDRWEPLNASEGDTHTLQHIGFLKRGLPYHPDVVLLLYVFNDMDYLASVTPRDRVIATGPLANLDPVRLLYRNSYLFQELFIRGRSAYYRLQGGGRPDPYRDSTLVGRHIDDIGRFCSLAADGGARVLVVPFDVGVVLDPERRSRYRDFVRRLTGRGLSAISLEHSFDGIPYGELTVNRLDAHPNEQANRLAAEVISARLLDHAGGWGDVDGTGGAVR